MVQVVGLAPTLRHPTARVAALHKRLPEMAGTPKDFGPHAKAEQKRWAEVVAPRTVSLD